MRSEQLFGNLIRCYNTLAGEWAEAVLRDLTFTRRTFGEIGRKKYITQQAAQRKGGVGNVAKLKRQNEIVSGKFLRWETPTSGGAFLEQNMKQFSCDSCFIEQCSIALHLSEYQNNSHASQLHHAFLACNLIIDERWVNIRGFSADFRGLWVSYPCFAQISFISLPLSLDILSPSLKQAAGMTS